MNEKVLEHYLRMRKKTLIFFAARLRWSKPGPRPVMYAEIYL